MSKKKRGDPRIVWQFSGAMLARPATAGPPRMFYLRVGNVTVKFSPEEALRLGKALVTELNKWPT